MCVLKPKYYILHLLLYNVIGLTHCTSHGSHVSHVTETPRLVVKPARLPVQGGGDNERARRLLSLIPVPAPTFLLRQDAHQRAASDTAAQAMPTCKRSGATWWERMGEELLREHRGTGGASLQCERQTVTPRSLPALAATRWDCLKYLYFPSNHSRTSLNSRPP